MDQPDHSDHRDRSNHPDPPVVILINGLSATGKTTIGRQIAEALRLPFLAKDAIKERLFDTLGYSDRAWSHKLSGVTHTILNYVIEEELKSGRTFVLESNFNSEIDLPKFQRWQEEYGLRIVQVLCYTQGEVVYGRFRTRVESGERHPGHVDHLSVEAWRDYLMAGKGRTLDVQGELIEVDTTNFAEVRIDEIVRQVQAHL